MPLVVVQHSPRISSTDDSHSSINGRITAGLFDGSIHTSEQTFHLEPAARYFPFQTAFHSIMFAVSNENFNFSRIALQSVRPPNTRDTEFTMASKQVKEMIKLEMNDTSSM